MKTHLDLAGNQTAGSGTEGVEDIYTDVYILFFFFVEKRSNLLFFFLSILHFLFLGRSGSSVKGDGFRVSVYLLRSDVDDDRSYSPPKKRC